ncbi:SWR1-complex protein 4-like, partial [Trifolium pratense]
LHVYLRTYALEQMLQSASSSAGLRTINRVDQTLQELGVNLKPRVPTKAVCAEHLELRNEILTLLNIQKQLQNKEAEGSSFRDGSNCETTGTPKRSHRGDQDRTFVPDNTSSGGIWTTFRSSVITGPIEKAEKTIGPGSLAPLSTVVTKCVLHAYRQVATGMDVMVCSALLIGIMNLVVSSGELKTSGNSDCG